MPAGIELDQPVGNSSGKSQGHRYFHCGQNHGLFVKKNLIVKEPLVGKAYPEHLESLNEEVGAASADLGRALACYWLWTRRPTQWL